MIKDYEVEMFLSAKDLPKEREMKGKYIPTLNEFLESKNQAMKINCKNADAARSGARSLKVYCEKNHLHVMCYQRRNYIYVIKEVKN